MDIRGLHQGVTGKIQDFAPGTVFFGPGATGEVFMTIAALAGQDPTVVSVVHLSDGKFSQIHVDTVVESIVCVLQPVL